MADTPPPPDPETDPEPDPGPGPGPEPGPRPGPGSGPGPGPEPSGDDAGGPRLPGWLTRLAALRQPSPGVRRILLLVAALVFVAGTWLSARGLELSLDDIRIWPLVLVAVLLVPATIAVNVAELVALGRLVAVRLGLRESLELVLIGTAANFLPLPGAAAVRVHALTARGASLRAATGINLIGALAWVGIGLAVAGGAGLTLTAGVAALLLVGGLAATAIAVVVLVRWRRVGLTATAPLLSIELGVVLVHAARLALVLEALSRTANARQVLVLAANGPLAAAAGIFPSGLGLAEALGAALAQLVALAAAAGFAVTAVNRIVGVAVTAPIAVALGLHRRPEARSHPDDAQANPR